MSEKFVELVVSVIIGVWIKYIFIIFIIVIVYINDLYLWYNNLLFLLIYN